MAYVSKRPRAVILALVLALALLPACGQQESESRSIIMAAPPGSTIASESAPSAPEAEEEAEPEPEDAPMDLSVAARSISTGYAGNDIGCYTLSNFTDTSSDIFYFDYEALTMARLEIPYQVDGLAGRLAGIYASATPLWAGDNLFIFRQRGTAEQIAAHGEAAHASVAKLSAAGATEAVCTFPEDMAVNLSSAALWDGEALYFMMQDFEAEEEDGSYLLAKLNASSMEFEELHRFESGWEYSIEGFWSMGPVIQAAGALPPTNDPDFNTAWNNRAYTVFRMGMATGRRTDLYSWTQGLPTVVHGSTFYRWDAEADTLFALDTGTGEERALASGLGPKNYVLAQLQPTMLDGLVRLQFSANDGRQITNYAVNPETGAVTTPQMEDLGDTVTVCAEGPGFFLVRNGEKWVKRELVDAAYNPAADTTQSNDSRYISMAEYALITTENYWAGNKTFQPIEDLVYGSGTRNSGGYTSYGAQQNATGEGAGEDPLAIPQGEG